MPVLGPDSQFDFCEAAGHPFDGSDGGLQLLSGIVAIGEDAGQREMHPGSA